MTPLIFNLGPTELIIILVIVLLLFGGSRLAGLGKSTGRALKEFKEETKDLGKKDEQAQQTQTQTPPAVEPRPDATWEQPPSTNASNPSNSDVRKDA